MTRLVSARWIPSGHGDRGGYCGVHCLRGCMGSSAQTCTSRITANADAIIQFNPKHVLYEIFGPAGTVADINYLDAACSAAARSMQSRCRGHSSS